MFAHNLLFSKPNPIPPHHSLPREADVLFKLSFSKGQNCSRSYLMLRSGSRFLLETVFLNERPTKSKTNPPVYTTHPQESQDPSIEEAESLSIVLTSPLFDILCKISITLQWYE